MKRSPAISATALAAVVFLAGCGTDAGSEQAGDTMPGMDHGSMSHAPSSSDATGHNSADTMFAQMMMVHHQQAVEMSEMVLAKDGLDPEIVRLAENIKAAQGPEIETMSTWLRNWGEPAHMSGEMPMDGMISSEGLAQLQAAQGTEASRLFLTQMIAHHEGAVAMAEEEAANGSNPEAVELATSMASGQGTEIQKMNGLLAAL
ncbi:uncharacterized protein (DUF305 family) [Arthrobacter sp. UYP6]|uniref:DUF305 domain-containing protein n=1 Tax=Arthrobacter sp. UYP6 TaxID=1756378 RepID=UPI0033965574